MSVLPGPSAVETALVANGLSTGPYRFLGYLPRRETELRALWDGARTWPYAAVAFESPRRLPAHSPCSPRSTPGVQRPCAAS